MDPLEFRLTSAHVADNSYVVTLSGELDLTHSAEIDRELEALTDDGAGYVVVDLLEVPFLESTVLGILLRHARVLRATGGELTLVTDDHRIVRVLEITGLTSHFRIEGTLSAAIDAALERTLT